MRALVKKAAAIAGPNWYLGDSEIQGQGAFAGKEFEEGDYIGPAMSNGGEDEFGSRIWNLTELARYCNHQRSANVKAVKHNDQYNLVATTAIQPDDELVADYVQVTRAIGPHSRMQWDGKDVPANDLQDYIEKEEQGGTESGNRPGVDD